MDPELLSLIEKENANQLSTINLIASENYIPKTILEPLSSCLSNKYAEGEPGKRLYPGVEHVDKIEVLTIQHLKKIYKLGDEWHVYVQALSGAPANLELLTALFEPGSKILMLCHDHGGHMSHGDKGSLLNKIFNVVEYRLGSNGLLDFDHIEKRLQEEKPAVLIAGFWLYPRDIDYARLKQLSTKYNAHLHIDMAHFSGIIAAGKLSSPFPHADSVCTTTHKVLRGPRGGIIFSRRDAFRGCFPGVQAGPHMATIAGLCQALYEVQQPEYVQYVERTLANAKRAAAYFMDKGFAVQTNGTDSHLIVVGTQKGAEAILGANGIYVSDVHLVGGEPGIRIGFPCMATFGIEGENVDKICEIVIKALGGADVKAEVAEFAKKYMVK